EEVVESCNRLKGGRLPVAKLKEQLQKMALKRTGGEKTDEVLGKNGGGPEGLPHSIIVPPEGVEGEVPKMVVSPANDAAAASGNGHQAADPPGAEDPKAPAKGRGHGNGRHGRAAHGRKLDHRPRSAHPKTNTRARRGKE